MKKKYSAYLYLIKDKEISISKKNTEAKELSDENCLIDIDIDPVNQEFLNKTDVDLLFPGHIKSYYASSEF